MKVIWPFNLLCLIALFSFKLVAQTDSTWHQKPEISISGFLDVFYVYDFNQPSGPSRQPFLFNHNRHNEFNVNLGLVKLGVEHSKYRANIAFQTGTYVNDNYASESGLLKNIHEANVGMTLNKKNNLWLDAGILPSYIGFESAISMDNWTLTRSLLAENSPYFVTGAKLTFLPTDKIEIAGLIMNGWQRIQRVEHNSLPSFGTQFTVNFSKKAMLNWSTFIGSDFPDSSRRMRYFNNVYGKFQISENIRLIVGIDVGYQQRKTLSTAYDPWFSPVLIVQTQLNNRWKAAARFEYYKDQSGIIVPQFQGARSGVSGVSLTIDYSPTPIIVCRLEGRLLNSFDHVFKTPTNFSNTNLFIGTSIAVKFSEILKKD